MRNPSGDDLYVVTNDSGSGPLVVLIHGFTASSATNFFPELYDRLSSLWNVASLDLSAHGRSGGRFEDMTFPKLQADIGTLLDTIASDRPVVLIGHSMGGSLSYLIASERSIAGLVLLAPGFEVRSSFLIDLEQRASEQGVVPFTDGFGIERTVSRAFFGSRRYDPLDIVRDMDVPTLIICAELDYTVSNETCERVARAMPNASFEMIADVGHTFADTDEHLGPLIERFLHANLTGDSF